MISKRNKGYFLWNAYGVSGKLRLKDIIRNSDTSLKSLVQLKQGKNLFTERFK
jgi:hypothetical protein